jgi:hypothetical protein
MRVEHKIIEWFTLAELKAREDRNAYEKAKDALDSALWNDGMHTEGVGEAIRYALGGAVKAPGWDTFGEGDFPGVQGVELNGWDLERGAHVSFAGILTPENSPGLPWHAWLEDVRLIANRYGTTISPTDSEDAPHIPWSTPAGGFSDEQQELFALRDAMEAAVQEALGDALSAGQKEAEWYSSEEYLDETAEANSWEFDTHGRMA